jgi:proteasome alpha subunit
MTMPYYASAEQIMRDRSEYARKGISRGRSVAVLTYSDGVLFIAENPSSTLHKVGELYDRIGFAAVGRYSEFESLRVAGVRLADVRGYSYNRRDVTGRVIANAYAQTLGAVFTEQMKPYEVELCVAEVGDTPEADQLYRLTFDGSIVDEPDFVVMGGQAEAVSGHLREHFLPGMGLAEALAVGVRALSAVSPATAANGGGHDQLPAEQLEVAVLDRRRPKRAFRRVTGAALHRLLSDEPVEVAAVGDGPAHVHEHAPSAPAPGTPPGLGDPEAVDTAGGTERTAAQPTELDGVGGGTEGSRATGDTSQDSGEAAGGDPSGTDSAGSDTGTAGSDTDGNTGSDDA